MHVIEWNEVNSVGVASIDEQHKVLVAITNKLFQAILDNRGIVVLMGVLRELEEYVKTHFSYEEELMRRYGYSPLELEEHIAEHRALQKQVSDFADEVGKEEDTLDIEVFDFLRDWMDVHLCETDMKYKDFFKNKTIL